jgi:competence protein ComEA
MTLSVESLLVGSFLCWSKVNINTAGTEELQTLPGIGEARAEAIIRYREEHGRFSGIEEIQNISGIKQKAFEKIKDYIEV